MSVSAAFLRACLPVLALLVALLVPGPANAQQPETFGGVEFPQGGISFADRVVSFTAAEAAGAPYSDPAKVLGAPDYTGGEEGFLAIGNGGSECASSLTLEFVDNYLIDVDGNDLWVFEIGPAVEATELFISTNGQNWVKVGRIEGSTRGVDIAEFSTPGQRFPFVRLCDNPDGVTSGSPTPGPDIDAVGAIGSVFRPPEERTDPADPAGGGAGAGASTGVAGNTSPAPPFGTTEPANVARMTIQAGQRQVVAGGTVWVPVYLLRGDNVANLNYEITYNSGVADATGGDPVAGSLLGGRLFRANPGDPSIVRVGFAGTSGVSGTGTVTWILFRAVGQPGDRTELSVTVSTINQPDGTVPAIDRINGMVIITDAGGLVPGDCDGDGTVTEFDARCALEISVDLRPSIPALDLNADNDVTSRDATLILQRATGRS
jgi:hypothetical protein